MKHKIIEQFIDNFKKEMTRRPTKQEIMHNVSTSELAITEAIIDDYLNNSQNNLTIVYNG